MSTPIDQIRSSAREAMEEEKMKSESKQKVHSVLARANERLATEAAKVTNWQETRYLSQDQRRDQLKHLEVHWGQDELGSIESDIKSYGNRAKNIEQALAYINPFRTVEALMNDIRAKLKAKDSVEKVRLALELVPPHLVPPDLKPEWDAAQARKKLEDASDSRIDKARLVTRMERNEIRIKHNYPPDETSSKLRHEQSESLRNAKLDFDTANIIYKDAVQKYRAALTKAEATLAPSTPKAAAAASTSASSSPSDREPDAPRPLRLSRSTASTPPVVPEMIILNVIAAYRKAEPKPSKDKQDKIQWLTATNKIIDDSSSPKLEKDLARLEACILVRDEISRLSGSTLRSKLSDHIDNTIKEIKRQHHDQFKDDSSVKEAALTSYGKINKERSERDSVAANQRDPTLPSEKTAAARRKIKSDH